MVPRTSAEALRPEWLGSALASVTGGERIDAVNVVEVIRTVATKIRFTIEFAGRTEALCLKGLLDDDRLRARGGSSTLTEADFYDTIKGKLSVRTPELVTTVVDRSEPVAVVIMRDVIGQGGRFCSALEAFTVDEAAQSLEQLARLHADGGQPDRIPWIERKVAMLVGFREPAHLQSLLDGPRSEGLPRSVADAARLERAVQLLDERDRATPDFLIHGDAHAGNSFRTADGPGLIDWQTLQRGGWAIDVAYHIGAVLPEALAAANDRDLLEHYLATMRGFGAAVPDGEMAWRQYREAAVYGYFMWAVTTSVDPSITDIFVQRLGAQVARHDSFGLLGL
jgi:hypothetical protein